MSQSDLEQHSLPLVALIKEKIAQNKSISFAQFMHMALYQPALGYYSSVTQKFGKDGDFITAPELGSLFAKTMATQFMQIIKSIDQAIIVELGAGTGQFTADCLLELDKNNCLPSRYYILEVSADLQNRQMQKIKKLPEKISQLVQWIQQPLQDDFNGVVFANEVVDALPVEVFKYQNGKYKQMHVALDTSKDTTNDANESENEFKKTWTEFPKQLNQQILAKELKLQDGYVSEFTPHLNSWLETVTENLQSGVVLFVDYGYERKAYYHPQRSEGTLICFHKQHANFDYFSRVGKQDLTAFVDFTSLAEAADHCGFEVDGFTTQAHFLMALGIHNHLGDSQNNYSEYYKNTTEMKKLTMPDQMGEKFKVIAFSRKFEAPLLGFSLSNQLHLL